MASGNPSQKLGNSVRKVGKEAIEGQIIDTKCKQVVKIVKSGRERIHSERVWVNNESLLVSAGHESLI